jgi:hypothetical protein
MQIMLLMLSFNLTHRLLAIILTIPKYWNFASLARFLITKLIQRQLKLTGGDAWMSRPKIQLT